MWNHSVNINGIDVSVAYSEKAVNAIFLPLLRNLSLLRRRRGKRILVMLAAPPGAGKSTLLSFLKVLSENQDDVEEIQVIGMDGFHRRQEYLLSHCVERDGKRIPMVEIKGAPVTFDLEKLTDSIRQLASGSVMGWPVYDRLLHNPIENAVTVNGDLVLLEGNYLLLDEEGWRNLSEYADYTISIRADEDLLRKRLIDRRIKTGVPEEAAVRFVDFSDMPNVQLCLRKTKKADCSLRITDDNDYEFAE